MKAAYESAERYDCQSAYWLSSVFGATNKALASGPICMISTCVSLPSN